MSKTMPNGANAGAKGAAAGAVSDGAPTFRPNECVVYPAHGVGKILRVERRKISGSQIRLLVIYFEKEKMTLQIPRDRAASSGLRVLSSRDEVGGALETLQGRPRIKRMMWSRRAQEYEQKINSGNLNSIAEVVRDLHRADDQGQSYSERQLYEQARDRLTREIAAVNKVNETRAVEQINAALLERTA